MERMLADILKDRMKKQVQQQTLNQQKQKQKKKQKKKNKQLMMKASKDQEFSSPDPKVTGPIEIQQIKVAEEASHQKKDLEEEKGPCFSSSRLIKFNEEIKESINQTESEDDSEGEDEVEEMKFFSNQDFIDSRMNKIQVRQTERNKETLDLLDELLRDDSTPVYPSG